MPSSESKTPAAIAATAAQALSATPVDIAAIEQAAAARAHADFLAQFKTTTGFDSLEAFNEAELVKQGKLQELADSKSQEAQSYKGKYEQTLIGNALLSSAGSAVDPADIVAALAAKGVVDANGNVSIDGKPVAEAVKALLISKPHWAKAQGAAGSGAGTASISAVDPKILDNLSPLELLKAARNVGVN